MRTFGIWVSGILGAMLIGGMVAGYVSPYDGGAPIGGSLAGALIFTCARLWIGAGKAK